MTSGKVKKKERKKPALPRSEQYWHSHIWASHHSHDANTMHVMKHAHDEACTYEAALNGSWEGKGSDVKFHSPL